jgi:hypothetical protein
MLEYAIRDHLTALHWSRVETIDDDLGRSAAGGAIRAGFQRVVAEVCLGKIGAIAARAVARFTRNSRDRQQLIETCCVVDTVLIDPWPCPLTPNRQSIPPTQLLDATLLSRLGKSY